MKKVLSILIGLAILTSCSKKGNVNSKEKPFIKWNFIKDVYIDSNQNYYHKDTIHYLAGSYAYLSDNGKVYIKASNHFGDFDYDTLSYKIDGLTLYLSSPGDSLNNHETDTLYTKVLTDTSLVLYEINHYKDNNGLPAITRDWSYLVR